MLDSINPIRHFINHYVTQPFLATQLWMDLNGKHQVENIGLSEKLDLIRQSDTYSRF